MHYSFFVVSGEDFQPDPNLSITFDATTSNALITECAIINIIDDLNIECDHDFTVEVGTIDCDVVPPIVPASPSATVVIDDDDGELVLYWKHKILHLDY